jgi:hypothetical protein
LTDISDFILFSGKTLQPDDKKEGLLQVQRLSFLRRKCPLSPTLRGNSFFARRYIPPNELCPALVSGLTVQPCGELRCSGTWFDFLTVGVIWIERKSYPFQCLNLCQWMVPWNAWEVQILNLLGGSRTKSGSSRTKNIRLVLLLNM